MALGELYVLNGLLELRSTCRYEGHAECEWSLSVALIVAVRKSAPHDDAAGGG